MVDETYISKEEALKKGYKKRQQGGYYKQSVLEKYWEKGWLRLENSPFSAEDRKKAGELLRKDFYLSNYNNLHSLSFIKISKSTADRENLLYYKERYLGAVKSVPQEFWRAVRVVCIEDCELKIDKNIIAHSLLSKQASYHLKMLLNLGLERLVKYYLQKNKKSS